MLRLIREILTDLNANGWRIKYSAVEALRMETEMILTELFADSNLAAIHGKRVTIMPKDMRFAKMLRNDKCFKTNKQNNSSSESSSESEKEGTTNEFTVKKVTYETTVTEPVPSKRNKC